ncbi:10895_t:CDS:2 [Funneliformis caledonium]|uniref:10895_t:CDS:1 n=1 Tax=Funneliformis caledonium TaxID=1117310 RepID=A0A9N8Z3J5_9GLOM|nr:10895_t:CDS:2 [Funneliformis caledonium]
MDGGGDRAYIRLQLKCLFIGTIKSLCIDRWEHIGNLAGWFMFISRTNKMNK